MGQSTHRFGDLLSQHLHRKHGLSQSKLAEGILQEPSVISEMCKGRRLTGPQARERVLAMIRWLHQKGALATEAEANALLAAAGLSALTAHELQSLNLVDATTESLPLAPNGFVPHTPSNNLPAQPTPFVGRTREVAEIVQRLQDPACRLLTLLGPGGVGKSRLSLEAAQRLAASAIPHGAYFVQLASVESQDSMVAAIAQALQFGFYSEVPARQQLLDYVREKQLLLILDNMEQLTVGALFLSEMLAHAPKLKLLVTSREALNVQEEWLYVVEGMALPVAELSETTASASDAMQLFVQCARRMQAEFGGERDLVCAQRICALVEGMPLGIELAASWLRVLPCEHIAHEIVQNLDILSSRLQNVPERHRSVRAVFEHSWRRLSQTEQQVFLQLSVWRGFRLEVAEQVGGASSPILVALVDKSLLQVVSGGRYQMHTLLRQLAEEKLHADPSAYSETLAKHSAYYLTFVAQREERLLGADQVRALDELAEESDNIRAAWERAVQQEDWAGVALALNGLYWFYEMRVRFVEGETAFQMLAEALHPHRTAQRALFGKALARQGAFAITAGRYDVAAGLLDEAQSIASAEGRVAEYSEDVAEMAFVLNRQGHLAQKRGKWMDAVSILEQSLQLSERIGDERNMARTIFEIAYARSCGVGQWDKVLDLEQRNLNLSRKLKLPQQAAYALEDLGTASLLLGRNAAAKAYYEESLPMFRALGDWFGYAKALNGLGATLVDSEPAQRQVGIQHQAESVDLLRKLGHRQQLSMHLLTLSSSLIAAGQYQQARECTQESMAISAELGDPIRIGYGYTNLVSIAIDLRDFALAKQQTLQGLLVCRDAQLPAPMSILLVLWVRASIYEDAQDATDSHAQHVHWLAMLYVAAQGQAGRDVLDDAEPLIAQLEAELTAEQVAEARALSARWSLDAVAEEIVRTEDVPH
jgi:predicted ATPase